MPELRETTMPSIYQRNPNVEESPLQGDLMLFDPDRSQFFVLNPTMACVWRNCDGVKGVEHVVASVANEFADVDAHPVSTEVKSALDELVALGLVAVA